MKTIKTADCPILFRVVFLPGFLLLFHYFLSARGAAALYPSVHIRHVLQYAGSVYSPSTFTVLILLGYGNYLITRGASEGEGKVEAKCPYTGTISMGKKAILRSTRSCPFGIVPSWTWHPQFHICVTQSPLCSYRLIFCLHINCLFLSWHPFSQLIHIHKLIASCYKTFPTPLNIGQENASEIINASNCSQHSAFSSNTYFPKFWHFVPEV